MVLIKYNSGGTKQWAKQFGLCIPYPICAATDEYGRVVTFNSWGNIFTGGTFVYGKKEINLNMFDTYGNKISDSQQRVWSHTPATNSYGGRVFKIQGDYNDSQSDVFGVVEDDKGDCC